MAERECPVCAGEVRETVSRDGQRIITYCTWCGLRRSSERKEA